MKKLLADFKNQKKVKPEPTTTPPQLFWAISID